MMEAMILLLGQQMSVSAAARHLAESDKRLDHHRGANEVVVKIVREKTALGQLIYEQTSLCRQRPVPWFRRCRTCLPWRERLFQYRSVS